MAEKLWNGIKGQEFVAKRAHRDALGNVIDETYTTKAYVDNKVGELAESVAEDIVSLQETKLDTTAFASVSGTFLTDQALDDYLTKEDAESTYQPLGDYMDADALKDVSGRWEDTADLVDAGKDTWDTVTAKADKEYMDGELDRLDDADADLSAAIDGKVDTGLFVETTGLLQDDIDTVSGAIDTVSATTDANAEDIAMLSEKANELESDIDAISAVIPSDATEQNKLVSTDTLNAKIADFGGFKIADGTGTDQHPDVQDPDTKFIYLVKDDSVSGDDKFKEWIYDTAWQLVGDTSMDLEGYVQLPDIHTDRNIVVFGPNDNILDGGRKLSDIDDTIDAVSADVREEFDGVWETFENVETALGTKQDVSAMTGYYTVDNPAGYITNAAIAGKVDTSAFDDEIGRVDGDIDFLSAAIDDIPTQVQSDWTEVDNTSPAFIQHKPAELSMSAGEGIGITESNDTLTFSVTGDYADAADFANLADDVDVLAAASADWDAKQDELVFGYDENDAISSINLSSIACQNLEAGQNVTIDGDIIDVKNDNCTAVGSGNIALGTLSIADGKNSFVYGLGEIGKPNIASGHHCINLGWHSSAIGNYSTVLGGNYCLASGEFGKDNIQYWGPVAQGLQTSAISQYAHAEGAQTLASGNQSHAEGVSTLAANTCTHSEGQLTSAVGPGAHTEGGWTVASGKFSHAEGNGSVTIGNNSHAEGYKSSASGSNSHAEGNSAWAAGHYSHAEGTLTTALSGSHTEGEETIADNGSHAEGLYTSAGATIIDPDLDIAQLYTHAHAEGFSTLAFNNYSHAEGQQTSAYGVGSHSEGNQTNASGNASHTEGFGTSALGIYSHAEGRETIVSGNYSHAEGYKTTADDLYSHAEGEETYAVNGSHTEGLKTSAGMHEPAGEHVIIDRGNAHAEGYCTYACHDYSHAEGYYTIASGEAQHVQGKYNDPNTTDLFQIGNGTGNNERSNAFIVTNAGLASAKNLGTSGYPDIDNTLTTMNQMIASFGGFKVVPGTGTDLHPDVASADTKTIYLTQDTNVTGNDQYKEWIWKAGDPEATPSVGSAWNLIGDTSIDLNGYAQMPVSHTASNIAVYGQGDTLVDNNVPLTSVQNVQSDWNETDSTSYAYINNKPDVLIPQAGTGVSATPKYIMVVTTMPAAAAIDPNTIYLVKENVS